jgi:NAD(P)-dependent dehydrogenase (short-subunit alcohol dehydrogenase family)
MAAMTPRIDEMLTGKCALVTGGGRGIGAHIAECLAEAGCNIALCSRTLPELNEVAARITKAVPVRFESVGFPRG